MGFFVCKSVRLVPVRFNLAKSSVGASIGVCGLRVGQNGLGRRYVFAGSGGVYLRERFGSWSPEQVTGYR